jgi:hypothetical protein
MSKLLKHEHSNSGIAFSIIGDDDTRPIGLMGRITPSSTKGRKSPPDPISGFKCEYTAFDKGHIMALELNGPDISENIVPQYSQWQETGQWKRMETDIKDMPGVSGAIFVAELKYPSHPNTYSVQLDRHSRLEIFDWKDSRIPDQLTIWVAAAGSLLANRIESELLKVKQGTGTLTKFDELLIEVRKIPHHADWDHSKMPDEDRIYLQNLQIRQSVHSTYAEYKTRRQDDIVSIQTALTTNPTFSSMSKKEKSSVERVIRSPERDQLDYTWDYYDEIKSDLISQWGWSPTDTTSLSGERIIKSTFGERTDQMEKRRRNRHMTDHSKYQEFQRQRGGYISSGVRYHPYARPGEAWRGTYRDFQVRVDGRIVAGAAFVIPYGASDTDAINEALHRPQVTDKVGTKKTTAAVHKIVKKNEPPEYWVHITTS